MLGLTDAREGLSRAVLCATLLAATAPLGAERRSVTKEGHAYTPSLAETSDRVWVAYKVFDPSDATSAIHLRPLAESGWGETVEILRTADDLLSPTLAATDDQRVAVVWAQQMEAGWRVRGCTAGPDGPTEPKTLSTAHSFRPSLAAGAGGDVWAAWQARRDGNARICVARRRKGTWEKPRVVSQNDSSNHHPDLATGPDGRVWVAWDSYRNGNYDVYLRRLDPQKKQWGDPVRVTTSMKYDMDVDAAVAPDGRVWLAWVRSPQWGLYHYRLNTGKRLLLRGYAPSKKRLLQPASRGLADRQGIVPVPVDARGRRLPVTPTVTTGPDGAVHLLYRQFRDQGNNDWGWCVDRMTYAGGKWSGPTRLEQKPGFQTSSVAARVRGDGTLLVACQACGYPGGRSPVKDGQSNIVLHRTSPEASASPKVTRAVLPAPRHRETFDVARPDPSPRPTLETVEPSRKLLWGELHQHTSLSKDVPERDGSLWDAYRWALDVAALDFFATTDHTEMTSDYEARRARIWADLFQQGGGLTTLYGAEQNFSDTEHTNFFATTRRGSRLSRRARKRHGDLTTATAWLTDQGMRGEVLVVRHFHGRGPRTDSPHLRPAYERAIEAVQTRGFAPGALRHYLDQSARPGLVAGPDHSRPPGGWGGPWVYPYALTGLWAKENTRSGVFDALMNRRAYATNGKRIRLRFTADGHLLGSAYRTEDAPVLQVEAVGTAPLKRVRLLRNDKVVAERTPGKRRARFEHRDEAVRAGEHRYLVRVTQEREPRDNYRGRAVSSPIWVTVE